DAELVRLRRRREAPCLVRAEAVLAGEDDGEAPAGPRLSERGLGDAEGDEARDLIRVDRDRAERRAVRVLVALAEALHLDEATPGGGWCDRVPAQRVRRSGGGRGRTRNVNVDVDELRAERAAEG